jgi:hypothetical protein
VRFASHVEVTDSASARDTKRFDQETFRKLMRSQFFLGAVSFWQQLEKLANPEPYTSFHALGVLRELAKRAYEDCGGHPYSPPQEEAFRYLGVETSTNVLAYAMLPETLRSPSARSESTDPRSTCRDSRCAG